MKWRCVDCFGMPAFCTTCCRGFHVRAPFHRIERWNGQTFYPSSMRQTGLILYLEHGGLECPGAPVVSQRTSGAATPTLGDKLDNNTDSVSNPRQDYDVLNPFDLSAISAALESSITAGTTKSSTSVPQSDVGSSNTFREEEDMYGYHNIHTSYTPDNLSKTGVATMMTTTMVMWMKLRSTQLAFPAPFSNSLRDMIGIIMSG